LETYRLTKSFPKEEVYGLIAQMRRAAVSISSNIVEGCARDSRAEYLRFLEISFGSARELVYPAGLAERLGYFLLRRKVLRPLGNWMSAKKSWLR